MKTTKTYLILAALVICLGTSINASAQLVTNGSFEEGACSGEGTYARMAAGDTTLTGWTIGGGGVDYTCRALWNASDGDDSVDMDGEFAGSLSQSITTAAGVNYVVTFDLSGNPAGGNLTKSLTVQATDSPSAIYSYTIPGYNLTGPFVLEYESYSYAFTATGPITSLVFTSNENNGYGPVLDNVAASAVSGLVCHRNSGSAVFKTLDVRVGAFAAHVAHGDQLGACK